ncbi:hypothetical protein D5086_007699 [Populus alba]|uniref:Uncharacterized protein n=1 Tax=Populus alba TaxID=43335 RepID=A0ACC4CEK1_POPAL
MKANMSEPCTLVDGSTLLLEESEGEDNWHILVDLIEIERERWLGMAFITDDDVRTVIPKGCSDSGERFCGGNLKVWPMEYR